VPANDIGRLLREMAAGDRRSFAELYDETSPYVFGILLRMLADREQAELEETLGGSSSAGPFRSDSWSGSRNRSSLLVGR
jgi:hypothetical protein